LRWNAAFGFRLTTILTSLWEDRMEFERSFEQWSVGTARIKWSAVFAGWVVGLALQMVLMLLGLGFGAWAIDFHENNSTEGLPTGAAIWTGVSMLIAAFTGGYLTSRLSGIYTRPDGLYHGIVVWGVNWLIFAWLTTTAVAAMIGGAFSTFGSTLQAVGQGVSGVASTAANKLGDKLEQVSWSPQELRKQIESIAAASGKSELQPGRVRQDVDRVAGAAQSGAPVNQVGDAVLNELSSKLAALDQEAAVNIMVNKMGMTREQANQLIQTTLGALQPIQRTVQDTVSKVKQQSAELGTKAVDRVGTMALWLAILAIITLGLSALGGALGTAGESTFKAQTSAESLRTDLRRAS
jgi:hypothetical protein